MNPNNPQHPWARLTRAARQVRDHRDATAPYGFATRVTALAFSSARSVSLIERYALRAVGVAALLALASVAVNFSLLLPVSASAVAEEEELAYSPVALLLTVD
jgi:hypothetical protein